MKKVIRNVSIISITTIGLLWFTYHSWESNLADFQSLQPAQKPSLQVLTSPVEYTKIENWIHAQGKASAVKKEHLAFEVDGKVLELGTRADGKTLREGSVIKAGQLLARLDDMDYKQQVNIANNNYIGTQNNVSSAQAQLTKAKANLTLAKKHFDRFSKLQAQGVSSKQAFDNAQASLTDAQAELKVAQAQLSANHAQLLAAQNTLSQAKLNLKRARIIAPWDGKIARLNIRKGDYSGPFSLNLSNATQMDATFPITVIDDTQYQVSVEIPSAAALQLVEGDKAKIRTVDTAKQNQYQWNSARVYSVAPTLSPESRNIRVVLRTVQQKQDLLDGEWSDVSILSETKKALVIPMQAVIYRDNKPTVFTVNSHQQVSQRSIELGIRQQNQVEVIKGLSKGMLVVTDGKKRLTEGDTVTVLNQAGVHHD
ncbi:efflux RND transporter periplasmic adaptor subunit [Parashewanella tropica]|uniref:efflux RND transporter periplasmic adaptor subunit n=1 Tax=Parashewanella tropica TaxID=2547970 RepID=UPI001478B914|nr:efflux RND transporter periplasmic adaptor subunit [Parashewanella tropica]